MKNIKILLKKEKRKGEKRLEKDNKILLKKKKESISIIVNIIKIFLRNKNRNQMSIWKIIIQHTLSTYWTRKVTVPVTKVTNHNL